MKKDKCSGYDYSLVELGRQKLATVNAVSRQCGAPIKKYVCVCIHCHATAEERDQIKHGVDCCFEGKKNRNPQAEVRSL